MKNSAKKAIRGKGDFIEMFIFTLFSYNVKAQRELLAIRWSRLLVIELLIFVFTVSDTFSKIDADNC
jgi:hypothetical protein